MLDSIIKNINDIKKRIEVDKDLSYMELFYLERHQDEIKKYFPNDIELWQYANIDEEEWINRN